MDSKGVLQQRHSVLVGIPNGIDTTVWNPASDPWLPASFTAKHLAGKAAVKKALLARCGMKNADHVRRAVVGMVSRMVDQKGLDLIEKASPDLLELDATFVILGTGEPKYEKMWQSLASRHPDRVAATVGFSEEMAHLVEGGADIFLMPSRFEPCGLNQMYSLRYGTVPVVRATGGLDDTVQEVDLATGEGTGFKFSDYSPGAMTSALRRAIDVFGRQEVWKRIQSAGMRQDHSWVASAAEYISVYQRAVQP